MLGGILNKLESRIWIHNYHNRYDSIGWNFLDPHRLWSVWITKKYKTEAEVNNFGSTTDRGVLFDVSSTASYIA